MRADNKPSQSSADSQDSENYGKADDKAQGMKEYGEVASSNFRLKYFRATQAGKVYWH